MSNANALIALGSAVVGGTMTTVSSGILDRRRWRRERDTAAQEHELDVRQATRMVERELLEAERFVVQAQQLGAYEPRERRVPTTTWDRWAEHLARQLGIADWQRVSDTYEAINDLNWKLDGRNRSRIGAIPPTSIAVADDDDLQRTWEAIRIATWVLTARSGAAEDPVRSLKADDHARAQLFGPIDPA